MMEALRTSPTAAEMALATSRMMGQRINEQEQDLNKARRAARRDGFVRADLAEPQARLCSAKTNPGVFLNISCRSHL